MQTTNFVKYLVQPNLISDSPENDFKTLINEFPYCQTGQIMLTVHLNSNNSILFDQQLKKSATYCTDRKKLFFHLHNPKKRSIVPKSHQEKEDAPPTSKKLENITTKNITAPPKTNLSKKKLDPLEKEYLSEAISSSILIESNYIINKSPKKKITITPNPKEPSKELFNEDTKLYFSDWVKYFNNDIKSIRQRKEKNFDKDDLINKFIQEDPKIKAKKNHFYSPANMAKLSVVENSDLVSETLASIYEQQGNYRKSVV